MSFCSLKYGYFLALLIPFYYIVPKRIQRYVLLVFSIAFYLIYSEKAFVIMTLSGIVVYATALWMRRVKNKGKQKILLFVAIFFNVSVLFFLKYMTRGSIILPLGISFYTLALIGFLVDVYREKIAQEKNFFDFYLFETFFPHILQGPIARYDTLAKQFKEKHTFDYDRFCSGLQLMLWGFIKKMVIADRAAIVVNNIYDTYYTVGGTELFFASLLYTLTIFADFSGCVDIARGTALIFDIRLSDNFQQPYLAVSINDFWKRWHISLSSWFRDYLYIPLGGNRKGQCRRWINVLLVFGVSGIWHGAGVNYLLWGALHGGYQVIGSVLQPFRKKCYQIMKMNYKGRAVQVLKFFITFQLVNIAWIFFRVTDIRQACYILKTILLHPTPGVLFDESLAKFGVSMKGLHMLGIFVILLFFVEIMNYQGIKLRDQINRQWLVVRWCVYLLGIVSVVILGIYGVDYNASDFIYMKF